MILSISRHVTIYRLQMFQECLFNAVACFLYLSASSYMGVAVNIYLFPRYAAFNMYAAYPAMTAVYVSITMNNVYFHTYFSINLNLYRILSEKFTLIVVSFLQSNGLFLYFAITFISVFFLTRKDPLSFKTHISYYIF